MRNWIGLFLTICSADKLMPIVILMGVSGCGKTAVGQILSQRLGCPFYDGDDFHPLQNVAKMAAGIPLTDDDRISWLAQLHELTAACLARGDTAVLACSALKRKYREQLRAGLDGVFFVYLRGAYDLIWQRLRARQNHYMKAEMLQSQFDALEEPDVGEAISVSIEADPHMVTNLILEMLPFYGREHD
jgi:gluconokinase